MNNTITRRDVAAGTICAKPVRAGVFVEPGLRINALTLAEKQRHCALTGKRPLSRDEAAALGFDAGEIAEWFGPAVAPAAESGESSDLVMTP